MLRIAVGRDSTARGQPGRRRRRLNSARSGRSPTTSFGKAMVPDRRKSAEQSATIAIVGTRRQSQVRGIDT